MAIQEVDNYDDNPLPITEGGTGATDRINAGKNLFASHITAPDYLFTLTSGWGNTGYSTPAELRSILGVIQYLGYITNLNTNYTTASLYAYCFTSSATNKPATAYGFVIEAVLTENASIQIAFTHDSTKMYKRIKSNGTWDSTWKSLTFA